MAPKKYLSTTIGTFGETVTLEAVFAFLVLFASGFAIVYHCTVDLEIKLAWNGFSPTYFLAALRHPEWFPGNYPSGAEEFLKSAPMLVYLLTDRIGLSAIQLMKGMIALEVVVVGAAAAWGVRQLRPDSGWTAAWLTALLLIAGRFAAADLGRWGYPFYGWVYSFGYGGAIVAVVAALRGRLFLSAIALGFAVASHTTVGLLAGLFVASISLWNLRNYSLTQILYAICAFTATGGAWIAYILLSSDVSGGGIPKDTFLAITKVMGNHWHPVSLGILWDRHWELLFPFFSICLLIPVSCANQDGRFEKLEQGALVGFAAIFIATFIGLLISVESSEPFLVKLAIQRASTLLLLVGAIFIVPRLWEDAISGNPIKSLLAALALVGPMVGARGVTIGLGLTISIVFLSQLAWRQQFRSAFFLVAGLVGAIVLLFLVYWSNGVAAHWSDYVGWVYWPNGKTALLATILLCAWIAFRWRPVFGRIGLLCLIGAFACVWSTSLNTLSNPDARMKATNYLSAQNWAHENTPVGSLFIPNPVHFYGWREASFRPSFGNVREWLYTGWLYNSNKAVFEEGWRRARSLGVDPAAYFNPSTSQAPVTDLQIYGDFEASYKSITADALSRLRQEYDVAYFVVEKTVREPPRGMTVVYENLDFAIIEIPQAK